MMKCTQFRNERFLIVNISDKIEKSKLIQKNKKRLSREERKNIGVQRNGTIRITEETKTKQNYHPIIAGIL